METGLDNMVILNADAAYMEDWFAPGEIKTLYLNFSDPWPKKKQAKRRLTHRNFLGLYLNLLGVGGRLFFKTDKRRWVFHTIDLCEQFGPEQLALALLIALVLPALGKLVGSLCNLFLGLVNNVKP